MIESTHMESIYDRAVILPEIIRLIATLSPAAWAQIAMACSDFGRYSMTPAGRREFAQRFLRCVTVEDRMSRHVLLVCGDEVRSVYDWPVVVELSLDTSYEVSLSDFIGGDPSPLISAHYWVKPVLLQDALMDICVCYDNMHRVGGPAAVYSGGGERWFQNGVPHRIDGPAILYEDGGEEWYLNGLRHRIDGPAIAHAGGREEWYMHGERHRIGGPVAVFSDGSEMWCQNGVLHRTDGPAMLHADGGEEWFHRGQRHRIGGPAVKLLGREEWWENGSMVDRKKFE